MVDHRIGCLPVVEGDSLIGIISDTDIFRIFVEALGGGHPSLRVSVVIPEEVGSLARLTGCIASVGGNIHSLGMFWGEKPEDRVVVVRLDLAVPHPQHSPGANGRLDYVDVRKDGLSPWPHQVPLTSLTSTIP